MQEEELMVIYRVELGQVHREMKKTLEDKETNFERISLNTEEFNNSGFDGQEIFYRGKMYDIRSVTLHGDKVELLAVNDTKEERILEQINHTTGQQDHNQKEMPGNIAQFIGLLYDFPLINNFSISPTENHAFSLPDNTALLSRYLEISSPPPELG
jgi:hypothetical protein